MHLLLLFFCAWNNWLLLYCVAFADSFQQRQTSPLHWLQNSRRRRKASITSYASKDCILAANHINCQPRNLHIVRQIMAARNFLERLQSLIYCLESQLQMYFVTNEVLLVRPWESIRESCLMSFLPYQGPFLKGTLN